jgi:polyisoprenoid-binding protein YceI
VPEQTTASYKVGEILFRDGNRFNLAVGTTNVVAGTIQLNTKDPASSVVGPITVDLNSLVSDNTRRDGRLKDMWLESAKFPKASFTSTKIDKFPADAAEGKEITFEITGDLTVREVTKPATFAVTATLQGQNLTGVATTTVEMTDFGITVPDIGGMLKAESKAIVELKFAAKAQ